VLKRKPCRAAEKGLPILGNAHKMGKGLFPPLFEKYGSTFMINMGPLGGWNLAVKDQDVIQECLTRNDDFGLAWPGVHPCSAMCSSD
jgi:hypothetical protein